MVKLLPIYLKSKWDAFNDWRYVALRFYRKPAYRTADLRLRLAYLFDTPYAVSKRYLMATGARDLYAYGHTPLKTMEEICRLAKVTKSDYFLDLGCGAAYTAFWMHAYLGLNGEGIDCNPEFIATAKTIAGPLPNLRFHCGDMRDAPFEKATFVYLYGSSFNDAFLKTLADAMQRLPKGARLATISYPMQAYGPNFITLSSHPIQYPWGQTDLYLQERC